MKEIFLTNSLSNNKEKFIPRTAGKVSMYVCGITPYDFCHLGHARAYISFDMIRRVFEYFNYEVTYIQNFTDIDDKIIARANEKGISAQALAQNFIDAYFEMAHSLKIKDATTYPKATETIPEIIQYIEKLVQKEFAYVVAGDVYFRTRKFKDYGKLSGRDLDKLKSGARVEVNVQKEDPLDFALWKAAKPEEPFWPSPFGNGRPGWHIECSVMSEKYLGLPIDIHGGGRDLIFPHHENEIAQSEACSGVHFVNYWLHNGFVNIGSEKMSKSLGNMLWVKDLIKKYSPQALRFTFLTTHYRSPIDFDEKMLVEAGTAIKRLHSPFLEAHQTLEIDSQIKTLSTHIENALADDFNAAQAISYLFEFASIINQTKNKNALADYQKFLELFGLYDENLVKVVASSDVNALLEKRNAAKKAKNFKDADALRDQILALGFMIEDTPQGVRLVKK
jgi:cysteinyl-tRNA synthetase